MSESWLGAGDEIINVASRKYGTTDSGTVLCYYEVQFYVFIFISYVIYINASIDRV
jgi:hypothetical protein